MLDLYTYQEVLVVTFSDLTLKKAGPSASAPSALALLQHATNCTLIEAVVITGAIDLKGQLLPVGGLVAKAKAAMARGITAMIVPEARFDELLGLEGEVRAREHIPRASMSTG